MMPEQLGHPAVLHHLFKPGRLHADLSAGEVFESDHLRRQSIHYVIKCRTHGTSRLIGKEKRLV